MNEVFIAIILHKSKNNDGKSNFLKAKRDVSLIHSVF